MAASMAMMAKTWYQAFVLCGRDRPSSSTATASGRFEERLVLERHEQDGVEHDDRCHADEAGEQDG